jgi:bifunctional DNA-binding transcriptional regulator/antitoxin component of YhaV-PrlF toxin-antitoxin module
MSYAITLTDDAQLTLSKDLLKHLGVKVGDQILIREMPYGKIEITALPKKVSKDQFLEFLDGHFKTDKKLTIGELNEEIANCYAEAGMKGIK